MNIHEFDALRSSAVDSFAAVTRSTESVYLRMGQAFPSLIRELESSFGTERTLAQGELSRVIDEAMGAIRDHEAQVTLDEVQSRGVFSNLEHQLAALGTLSSHIDEIREDSVLMELFSLNALVIAVKAGPSGQAFSCITSELKKLSNHTMVLTDTIANREASLSEAFLDFQASLTALGRQEQAAIGEFLSHIHGIFDGLGSETSQLLGGLEAISRKSDAVKGPLVKIMIDIQDQDRIRQSLDHVVLSLQEFQRVDEGATIEARLDELSLLEILPDLSALVLDEVSDQILHNRDSFGRFLGEARSQMEGLEAELGAYVGHQYTRGQATRLEGLFRSGSDVYSAFVARTEALQRNRELLVRKSATLQKKVSELVDSLTAFQDILAKFRNIDLASRIQVARQAALASMKDNAAGMSGLTRKIDLDVTQAMAVTSSFFSEVQALFSAYREQLAVRVRKDQEFNRRLHETMGRLEDTQGVMDRSIRESRVFSHAFTDQFVASERDLVTLDNLLTEIATQKQVLGVIKARVVDQKSRLLAGQGLTEWRLAPDKLKAMVSRFTIFTHKQFAAELGNFEVEQGVESGEVTLF